MILFGIAFGIIEIVLCTIFFILLVIGTAFDRHGYDAPKWWILFIGGAILVTFAFVRHDVSTGSVWDFLRSWAFWKPVLYYLAFGLVYSVVEFFFEIKRAAKHWDQAWRAYLQSNPPKNSADRADLARKFVSENRLPYAQYAREHPIIDLEADGENVKPKMNKTELADSIGAWTLLWPPYAVSLLLNDLLQHIWEWMSELLVAISGRFVRFTFRDTFKF